MPEWHQLDSSSTKPQQQESTKKKTLKSSSRSFWFSTGLYLYSKVCDYFLCSTRAQKVSPGHDGVGEKREEWCPGLEC